MFEFPFDQPIWQDSHRAVSPDGKHTAEISHAAEVSMGNPTKGTLALDTVSIPDCSPGFHWSEDSRYLAVPQFTTSFWSSHGKQRLLVIDIEKQHIYASGKMAFYIQVESFASGILSLTLDLHRKGRQVKLIIPEELKQFRLLPWPGVSHPEPAV